VKRSRVGGSKKEVDEEIGGSKQEKEEEIEGLSCPKDHERRPFLKDQTGVR
jgi:hypothetical protein